MTTAFHDRQKPFDELARFLIQEGRRTTSEDLETEIHLSTQLASLFNHLRQGLPLEEWNSSTYSITNHPLCCIMHKWSNKENHGIKGAYSLLKCGIQTEQNKPVVYNAALAIALHNGDPRQDLLEKDIFPIKMIQFPLIALLLYCDAVHEWNRTEASKNQLVDIEFGDSKVKFVVHFDRSTDAEIKAHEFSSIDQCLIEAPLILEFGSSYAVGQRRLNREVMKGG